MPAAFGRPFVGRARALLGAVGIGGFLDSLKTY